MARVLTGLALVTATLLLVGAGARAIQHQGDARRALSAHALGLARSEAGRLGQSLDLVTNRPELFATGGAAIAFARARDRGSVPGSVVMNARRALDQVREIGPKALGVASIVDAAGRQWLVSPSGGAQMSRLLAPTSGSSPSVTESQSSDGRTVLSVAASVRDVTGSSGASLVYAVAIDDVLAALGQHARTEVLLIDGNRARVLSSASRQVEPSTLAERSRVASRFATGRQESGTVEIDGDVWAFQKVSRTNTGTANPSRLIAVRTTARVPSLVHELSPFGLLMALAGLGLGAAGLVALRTRRRDLERSAQTDQLTGIPNRRMMLRDLQQAKKRGDAVRVALFDLNGFKQYNDTFGHQAGDALLARLAFALHEEARPGRAYRLGGDEFCVISPIARADDIEAQAAAALTERGQGFAVDASWGSVAFPAEAGNVSEALAIADERMYRHKRGGLFTALAQTKAALKKLIAERDPGLADHHERVAGLAERTARELGLSDDQVAVLRDAAELHDIGLLAIPDAIRAKAGALDEAERAFINRHPVIGERILGAAQCLQAAAAIVRASHERWDGAGYPAGREGDATPVAARIIAACDAYDTMTNDQPYRPAMAAADARRELRAGAGRQHDAAVVEALERVLDAAATTSYCPARAA